VSCLFFYALAGCGLASFLRQRRPPSDSNFLPPVSILKPLKGLDPESWESFRSHAEQDYPEFELIFGVSDASDPACEVVRKLQAAFPGRAIKLVVCERTLGANIKVSNLAQMAGEARYEVLLVNDSDIRVEADYLRRVVAPLADPNTGLVTCLYRGVPAKTIGSRLEALGIATDFAPGVLSARLLEKGLRFGLGSTLVFRRRDLAAIGGFESFVDYLADDYELGRRMTALGKRVELSEATVATFLPPYGLGGFWRHQLRWARTIRDARRWGYAGLIFTFGLPWGLAALVVSKGAPWAWALLAIAVAVRLAVGLGTAAALADGSSARKVWLLPARDLIAPIVWAAGLVGNRIQWRGEEFALRDGRLRRLGPAPGQSPGS
jgi:ceramide glucosyltransferase